MPKIDTDRGRQRIPGPFRLSLNYPFDDTLDTNSSNGEQGEIGDDVRGDHWPSSSAAPYRTLLTGNSLSPEEYLYDGASLKHEERTAWLLGHLSNSSLSRSGAKALYADTAALSRNTRMSPHTSWPTTSNGREAGQHHSRLLAAMGRRPLGSIVQDHDFYQPSASTISSSSKYPYSTRLRPGSGGTSQSREWKISHDCYHSESLVSKTAVLGRSASLRRTEDNFRHCASASHSTSTASTSTLYGSRASSAAQLSELTTTAFIPKGRSSCAINQRGVCGALTEFFDHFEQRWKSERLNLITSVLTTDDQARLLCQCSTMLVGHIPTIKDFIQQKCEPLVQDLSRSIEPNLSSVIAHLLCAQRSRSRNCLTILQETTAFLANTNALVMDIPLDLVIPMLNGKYSEQLLYLQSHNPFSTFSCTNTFGNSGDNDTALSTHDLGDAVHPSIVSISKLCELWDEALEYSRLTAASFDFQADDYLAMASVLSGLRDKWEIEGGMLDCSPTHSGSRRGCKGDDGGDEETAVDRILRILNRRARECKVALHRKQIDPGDGRQKQTEPHQQPLEALRLQAQVRKHLQQQHHHQHQQQPQDEQRQDLRPSWAHNSSLPRQRHSVAPHSPVDDDAVAVSTAGSMTTGFHGEAVEEDDGDERDEADEMLLDHADRDAVIVKTEEEDGPTSLSATLCMRKDQFYQTKRKCPLGGMPTYNTSSGNGGADTNGSTAMYEHEQMVESPHDVNDIRYGEEFNRAAAFVSTNLSRKRRYELSEEENAVFAEDEDEEDEDEDEVSVVRLVGDSSTSLTDSRTMAAVFGRMLVNNTHPDQEKSQTASFPAIPESEASNSERSKQHSKSVGSTGPSMLTEPHSLRSSGLQHSFRTTVTNHHPPVTALLLPTQTVRTAPKKKRGMNTTDGHHDENAHRMDQRPATSDSARDQHAEARLAEALSVSDSHHTNEEHIGEMGAQTATTTIEEPSHTASVMKDPQQRRRGLRQRNTLADKQPSRKRDSRSALEQLARRKGVKYEVRQLLTDQLKNFYVPPDLCRHHRIRNSSRRRGVVMSHPTRRLPAPPTSLQMKARPSRSRKSVAP